MSDWTRAILRQGDLINTMGTTNAASSSASEELPDAHWKATKTHNYGCEYCGHWYPGDHPPFVICYHCGKAPSYHHGKCCPKAPVRKTNGGEMPLKEDLQGGPLRFDERSNASVDSAHSKLLSWEIVFGKESLQDTSVLNSTEDRTDEENFENLQSWDQLIGQTALFSRTRLDEILCLTPTTSKAMEQNCWQLFL